MIIKTEYLRLFKTFSRHW